MQLLLVLVLPTPGERSSAEQREDGSREHLSIPQCA